jgi:hypothetical protein
VIAALATAAVVNLAEHPSLERDMSDWYEAVRVKPGHDISAMILGHFDATQERFALYAHLRARAPGATVVLQANSRILDEHLRGLAAAGAVVRSREDLTISAEQAAALEPYVIATGDGRHAGVYSIAMPEQGAVDEIVILIGPDRTWVVARSLLAGNGEAVAP